MQPTPEIVHIACDVLEIAERLDRKNIKFDDPTSEAWAYCFAGQPVWPSEARAAVYTHYQQANAFPIKPGDVIAYCKRQPVWSSADHVNDFLNTWSQYPNGRAIEDFSGIPQPDFEAPDDVPREERRDYRIRQLTQWIDDNRSELVAAILQKRHKVAAVDL
ncbi:hypothetical protein [Nocardia sp. CY41]|uniref:hypothetical protein n=1 Tax=Nocardia sp. CY41 TaxID=2608686 RepID=UPI00135B0EDB|nr:hypothetical protein [Nocardia sp. CY41]